jgi:Na+/H+ antiporter NhaA
LLLSSRFTLRILSFQTEYIAFWEKDLGGHSITHWINDGLMTIFFLLIGLELEREIYHGELSSIKNASLPLMAALGGMLGSCRNIFSLELWNSNSKRSRNSDGHRHRFCDWDSITY